MGRLSLVLIVAFAAAFSSNSQVTLTPNVPVAVAPTTGTSTAAFQFTPVTGVFNVIGLASSAGSGLSLQSGITFVGNSAPAPLTNFLIAPPFASPSLAANLTVTATGGGTAEHATPQAGSINSIVQATLGAGYALKLVNFGLSSGQAGLYEIVVAGDSSLRWYLFSFASLGAWGVPSQATATGTGTAGAGPIALANGSYVMVVTRDGGAPATDLPFAMRVATTSTHLTLSGPGASLSGLLNANYEFTSNPTVNRWNAVGVDGALQNVNTLYAGPAVSASGVSFAYVVANGHQATILPTEGLLEHSGTSGGTLKQATIQTVTVGTPVSSSANSQTFHVFEFQVASAGFFNVGVTGPGSLGWALFPANGSAAWRPKSSSLGSGFLGTTMNSVSLAAGWHAIVVSGTGSVVLPGTMTCSITQVPNNPVPTLGSISPTSATAGGSAFTLTANGTQFVSGASEVRWNGTALATTFVSATQLTAAVPASLIAQGGTASVTVVTAVPGGGTSSAKSFAVMNVVPSLTSISPSSVIAGNAGFTLTINGTGFGANASAFVEATALATTVVSPTQITALVPSTAIRSAGTAQVRVSNPAPGGGTSAPLTMTIRPPVITQLGTSSIPVLSATSAPINVLVNGTDFLPNLHVYADATILPRSFLSSSLVQVTIGPSVAGALRRGGLAITIENGHFAVSNAMPISVGGGSNVGTIVRHPLIPLTNEPFTIALEGGAANAPLVLIVDLQTPAPIYPFPDATGNLVLSVRPFAVGQPGWVPLVDSIGLFGAPQGPTYDASGRLDFAGLAAPPIPFGVTFTVQAGYLDPAAPLGFRTTWPSYPLQL